MMVISLVLTSCGGGDGLFGTDSTTVVIGIGRQSTDSSTSAPPSVIPPSVRYVRIVISGTGMDPIERTVDAATCNTVEEVFQVPNGPNRHFTVYAYDDAETLLYYGDEHKSLNGMPTSVTVTMASMADQTPPVFGGVGTATVVSGSQIDLAWSAATDDSTQQQDLVYLVYIATSPGGQDFLVPPSFTTPAGATSFSVTGLASATTYYFVVRAMDESGNIDGNTVEVSATTLNTTPPSSGDTMPPTFGGVETATPVSGSQIDLTWTAATDNVSASSNIVYLIYIATTSGGQDFLVPPSFTTPAGATSFSVTGLTSATTYYFVVRAKDEAGNVETNTVEVSATTLFSMH